MKSDLGIVIVNWKCKEEILECLKSVKKAGFIENIVVVDNGSEDGSVEKLKSQNAKVKILENGENLGFAEGNNVGIRYLLGNSSRQARTIESQQLRYIFILNPDTEINKNTIPLLLDVMERDERIGICGPKIYFDGVSSPLIWSCGGMIDKNRYSGGLIGYGKEDKNFSTGSKNKGYEVDYIPGTAMIVRKQVFEKCGLFDPDYFIYYEDVDLNLRSKKAGYNLIFVPSSTIIHHESTSMGKNSPSQEYYMARNHLLFVERNAPLIIKFCEFIRLPKTIYEHSQKGEGWALKGIRDYFLRRFGKRDYWS